MKPPRRDRDKRVLIPAGVFGGKAPLRLAAQKSRPHAPLAPRRGGGAGRVPSLMTAAVERKFSDSYFFSFFFDVSSMVIAHLLLYSPIFKEGE